MKKSTFECITVQGAQALYLSTGAFCIIYDGKMKGYGYEPKKGTTPRSGGPKESSLVNNINLPY